MSNTKLVRAALLLGVALACGRASRPTLDRASGVDPTTSSSESEEIWLAILRSYASRAVPTEGDVTLGTNRMMGVGEQGSQASVVLLTGFPADGPRFRSAWLDRVRHETGVRLCDAAQIDACPDSVMTSFLELGVPQFTTDSRATVAVTDHGLNPWACRRKTGAVMGGVMWWQFELARNDQAWTVVKKKMNMGGTTFCGFSPEEEARMARVNREDSLLRANPSPVAGTYRVTIVFESGDSSVVFTRTEAHPMSSIRDNRRPDPGDDEVRPIVGYYLATCSAASIDSIPAEFSGLCLQSYYAVSIEPIAVASDSTLFHGEVDPLVEVTFLDSRAAVRTEAHDVFGASEAEGARNSQWYFMPGTWIVYADRRVRHDWTVMQGPRLAYRVRAELVSTETLRSRSR